MTIDEAEIEAERRWGNDFFVEMPVQGFKTTEDYVVGFIVYPVLDGQKLPGHKQFVVKGVGLSFEEAFADADRKEKEVKNGE